MTGEDGQQFLRPVIRLQGKVFTRIDPKRNETSMLIRIRQGWDVLSSYLRGEDTPEKRQRFKIWVCTAAERGYALEAWRLLDPSEELIPRNEIPKRLFCAGKQKKSLFRTFKLGPLHGEPFPEEVLCPSRKLCPLNEGHSEMAMAIIADDRLDVWEKRNQDQVLQIAPYQYPCIEEKDPKEIQRMLTVFQSVRSQFYFELMEQMAPSVREAWKNGFPDNTCTPEFQETMKRAVSIAPVLNSVLNPTSVTPAPPPPPPPPPEATVMEMVPSLKPNDRRQIGGENKQNNNKAENEKPATSSVTRPATNSKRRRNVKRQRRTPPTSVPPPPDAAPCEMESVAMTPMAETPPVQEMEAAVREEVTPEGKRHLSFRRADCMAMLPVEIPEPPSCSRGTVDLMEDVEMQHDAVQEEGIVEREISAPEAISGSLDQQQQQDLRNMIPGICPPPQESIPAPLYTPEGAFPADSSFAITQSSQHQEPMDPQNFNSASPMDQSSFLKQSN